MGELQISSNNSSPMSQPQQPPTPRTMPAREDCWSEDATSTLIEAWGQRYIELNRGNLRQKQWQEVSYTVNSRHGHVKKARRTDIQCKNRIDTLKKKYKVEKARVLETNGSYKSPWPFFEPLDQLIGTTVLKKVAPVESPVSASGGVSQSLPYGVPLMRVNPLQFRPVGVAVGANAYMYGNYGGQSNFGGVNQTGRGHIDVKNGNSGGGGNSVSVSTPVLPQKRPSALTSSSISPIPGKGEEYFRRNYATVAAAAARQEESEDESEEFEARREQRDEEDEDVEEGGGGSEDDSKDGIRKLARVIEMFGEVYARVEREKQRQLVELEKQRMQFAKEMECQRMQMLVEMRVQLAKINPAKRSISDDMYSSLFQKTGSS